VVAEAAADAAVVAEVVPVAMVASTIAGHIGLAVVVADTVEEVEVMIALERRDTVIMEAREDGTLTGAIITVI
jgi:hypothetical protein